MRRGCSTPPGYRARPSPYGLRAGPCIPASLQLVGPLRSEELLLATALRIEAALA